MAATPVPPATEALAAPAAGTAAPTVTAPLTTGAAPPELGASVLQMMFGLAVVIALLLATLWLIRRLGAPRGGGAAIKVLGAAAVGPRERVVLVELGEQVLVLGVAPGSVTRLHDMKRSELPLPANPAGTSSPGGKAFAAWLRQATERRNAG